MLEIKNSAPTQIESEDQLDEAIGLLQRIKSQIVKALNHSTHSRIAQMDSVWSELEKDFVEEGMEDKIIAALGPDTHLSEEFDALVKNIKEQPSAELIVESSYHSIFLLADLLKRKDSEFPQ